MKVNVETKFNVGDNVFRDFLGSNLSVEILGIEIHVNKKNEIEIYYNFKPYSDRSMIDIIREDQLFTEEEISK